MHRASIPARDLRILGPLMSNSSTILGREKAIVLNLEHIKAIITAEEVLLLNANSAAVIPFVEELRRRIPLPAFSPPREELASPRLNGLPNHDSLPFEFRVLEVALEAVSELGCSCGRADVVTCFESSIWTIFIEGTGILEYWMPAHFRILEVGLDTVSFVQKSTESHISLEILKKHIYP